jgi:hypothetical protein
MRKKNWRFISVGLVLIVAAGAFFIGMPVMLPRSNDPVELMRTLGEVSGVVCALGLVLIVLGFMGKRF